MSKNIPEVFNFPNLCKMERPKFIAGKLWAIVKYLATDIAILENRSRKMIF